MRVFDRFVRLFVVWTVGFFGLCLGSVVAVVVFVVLCFGDDGRSLRWVFVGMDMVHGVTLQELMLISTLRLRSVKWWVLDTKLGSIL